MSGEGDDWFERALREGDEPAADDGADSDSADSDDPDAGTDDGADSDGADARAEATGGGTGGSVDGSPDADPIGEDDPFGGRSDDFDADADVGGPDDGGGDVGFGSLEGVDDPPADADAATGTTGVTDTADGAVDDTAGVDGGRDGDPFGGAREDPFGGRSDDLFDGASDDPFGDDFGTAMENTPGGGFGSGFGGDGPEFDEEEFDSDIDRIDVGVEGLDEMILGGVPERSLMTVIGSAGTGKTTFGLQFLNEALANDGDAVYITLEESREAILSTAEEKGWEYRRHEEDGRLAVVAMDPIVMANSLDSIRDDIARLVTEFGADRLVLDSVSLLEMMYDHPSKRRSEVFDFARSLKDAGVTTMLTSEASDDNPYASRHGIVEYLTDAVFVLQYVRPSDFRETRLAVEIQKIRDANHSRETKPYEITDEGISVYRQANIF